MLVEIIGSQDRADTTGVNATAWLYGGECYWVKCTRGTKRSPRYGPEGVGGVNRTLGLDGVTHKR